MSAADKQTYVYIGGYAPAEQDGIRAFVLDEGTGALTPAGGLAGVANPSFLAASPDGRTIYAASEVGSFNGRDGVGAVAAVAVGEGGALSLLGQECSEGAGPCHVSVTPDGGAVLAANYGGGSVARLPVGGGGALGAATGSAKHDGPSRAHPGRQENCHAHSITPHPSGAFAVACDLGADRLFVYRLDGEGGGLTAAGAVATRPGAGPRHLDFSADGRFAYVVNELDNTVAVYEVDPAAAALTEVQVVGTLPEGFTGSNTTAEVRLHPSGRFLYASNRGHDSIATFLVDADTGRLAPLWHTPTGGKTPRNFAVSPSGRWLIAANQDSDSLTVFRVDPDTGRLEASGDPVATPKPTRVLFLGAG
jgi:6-phosphogluconolactonase